MRVYAHWYHGSKPGGMESMNRRLLLSLLLGLMPLREGVAQSARAGPETWREEWPRTDFARHSVPLDEIRSGGVPKDGIPAIDKPRFVPVGKVQDLGPQEPVIAVTFGGEQRAYPLRILLWHEIVNDMVGGVPIAVTYCPLCNSAIVFDRRVGNRVLEFGVTGKLRYSNLIMYDRQTESWWQQFLGNAIVGAFTGTDLKMLSSRIESFERFRARAQAGQVLVPPIPELRPYGENPYVGYDSSSHPFLYDGLLPESIAPLERVVVIGKEAWALPLLEKRRTIRVGDLTIHWEPGQNSALDAALVGEGRDVGNVTVTRASPTGPKAVVYDVSFAFAFHAFFPDGVIHTQ